MGKRIMTSRILWFAMLMTIGVYVLVLNVVVIPAPTEPLQPLLPLVFGFVSLSVALLSFIIPKSGLRRGLLRLELPLIEVSDPNAAEAFNKTIRTFAKPEQAAKRAFAAYNTALIVGLALSESIALYGLVLGFLGYGSPTAAPFFAFAAVLIAVRFPTEAAVLRPLESAYDAKWLATQAE
ncbi:MAG TPA: hypothetical protein VGP93_20980 [Polyangiaceae bacterium]|jgi:F0F1-type ATP synthase membrane subunit c/vacuolar-type H+-ATPase subunit K|nr:hypothetical protein [Polyangiaceae bacterium]